MDKFIEQKINRYKTIYKRSPTGLITAPVEGTFLNIVETPRDLQNAVGLTPAQYAGIVGAGVGALPVPTLGLAAPGVYLGLKALETADWHAGRPAHEIVMKDIKNIGDVPRTFKEAAKVGAYTAPATAAKNVVSAVKQLAPAAVEKKIESLEKPIEKKITDIFSGKFI